jgi:hypothetical protein
MSWIDDIGPNEFFKGIADAMKGKDPSAPKGKTADISDDFAANEAALKKLVAQIKETTKTSKMLATAFEGGKVAVPDFTENIKELDEAITKAKDEQEVEVLQQRKRAMVRGQVEGTLKASAVNLATGFASAAYGLVLAGLDLTKGIIEGQDAISVATQAQIAQIKAQAKIGATIGEVMGSLGPSVMMVGARFGPLGIALGALLTVLGPFIKMASEKSAELAEKGLEILSAQLKQVRKGFFDLADTGVHFAGGMTEMTLTASRAGLRVEDFAKAIKESEEDVRGMGGGMSMATQRLAGISGEIRKGQLGRQLQNMGIQLTEQAKVAAAASAQLQASGRLRQMSDTQVAQYTVRYAKDLKLLQEITGKDAEKALAKARQEAMAADIKSKILREGGQDALTRFEQAYAATPEALRKGLLEKMSLGTVVDVPTNVAMQANKGIGLFFDQMIQGVKSGGPEFQKQALVFREQLGQSAMQISEANRSISQGARATGDALLTGVNDINVAITEIGVKIPAGTVQATNKIIEGAKETKDGLTNAVHNLDDAANKIAVGLQTRMLGAIEAFANKSKAALDTIEASLLAVQAALSKMDLDAAALAGDKIDEKNRKAMHLGDKITQSLAIGVENITGMIPGIGKDIQKAQQDARRKAETEYATKKEATVKQNEENRAKMSTGQKAVSMTAGVIEDIASFIPFFGTMLADAAEKSRIENEKKALATSGTQRTRVGMFSKGGIANQPSIFGEKGPEAAVPLPDGRTIPVSLKMDKFAENLAKFLDPGAMMLKKVVTGGSQAFKASAPGSSMLDFAKQINEDIAKMSRVTATPPAAQRRETERTVDDIALLMEAQLSRQDAMIKQLKDILTVNKGMLSAYS